MLRRKYPFMYTRSVFTLAAIFAVVFAIGCGGTATNNAANTTSNTANANSTNPLETTKSGQEATVNNAPTLTPAVKAYCDAWMKNDEEGLRKSYSSDTIKYFEDDMKTEKIKSLIKYLEDDKVS